MYLLIGLLTDDYVPVSLSSGGAPRGQEPTHYPLSLMGQCSSTSPHGRSIYLQHYYC